MYANVNMIFFYMGQLEKSNRSFIKKKKKKVKVLAVINDFN